MSVPEQWSSEAYRNMQRIASHTVQSALYTEPSNSAPRLSPLSKYLRSAVRWTADKEMFEVLHGDYSDERIGRYEAEQAAKQLSNSWGNEIVRWSERMSKEDSVALVKDINGPLAEMTKHVPPEKWWAQKIQSFRDS